jgi:hypothetical protein
MTRAPAFYLTAVGAARVVGGPPAPTVPLLLVFHSHLGADTAFNINAALREYYPSPDQLLIASVVDLHHIPRFMRSPVELALAAAYHHAAKQLPAQLDPTEYVLITPDWTGKVTSAYAMAQRANDIGFVLITKQWMIFDSYTGADPIAAAHEVVLAAMNSTETV